MREFDLWQEYGVAFGFLAHIINYPPNEDTVYELQELFSESTNSQMHSAYKSIAEYFEAKKEQNCARYL